MKVHVDPSRCQGHGRCYDLAPQFFTSDDEGYGSENGDGTIPDGQEHEAQVAAMNCPEMAIDVIA
jgi:ferredoxin